MPRDPNQPLQDLLSVFRAHELGEGDPIAGANLLAAMACSLANIARPGSCLRDSDGRTYEVGCSLLVSGSLSSSLITDEVTIDAGKRQTNLNAHLRHELKDRERAAKEKGAGVQHHGFDMSALARDSALKTLLDPLMGPLDCERPNHLAALTEGAPFPGFDELLARSRVFMTGQRPHDIEKQLEHSHRGRPLVHISMNAPSDFARFGELADAVTGGRYTRGEMDEPIRGHLLVTDPSTLLGEEVRQGEDTCHWIGRLPWLVDGDLSPNLPEWEPSSSLVVLDGIHERYRKAMKMAWGHRIEFHKPEPTIQQLEYSFPQKEWVTYLSTLEPRFPGITGTARGLLATLRFGLYRMVRARTAPREFRWSTQGIEAFARFLVERMASARAEFLFSAEQAWRERQLGRIVAKLQVEGMETRELYRALSMPAQQCREFLSELQSKSVVNQVGPVWEVVDTSVRIQ